nr:PREDICTED: serine protease 27-like [Latimeria chalumnae]|eukprot:XP_006004866.1 PREDICTED: serine protease 27-like [Latimeria chalumnae]
MEDLCVCGGGSLIAAHCINSPRNVTLYKVFLGKHQLMSPSSHEAPSAISRIIIHENCPDGELSKSVNYTDYILPICLPASNMTFQPGSKCWVTGWGTMNTKGRLRGAANLQDG